MDELHAFVVYKLTQISIIKSCARHEFRESKMGLYKNIDVDFVERTAENLKYLEEHDVKLPQEITHLLNYCYGLFVVPEQKMDNIITMMSQDLLIYGIKEEYISTCKPKTFKNFVRSMRNGFAHAHLQSLAQEGSEEFSALAIMDYKNNKEVIKSNPHTTIELSLEQLKNFIIKFSLEYLKYKKQLEQ